jgi:hypothetical protein
MPLLDHFHPPLDLTHHWESFHSNWATRIADALSDMLPPEFIVEEYTHTGARLEIDVATFDSTADGETSAGTAPATTLARPTWRPTTEPRTMPSVFPDSLEVRVFQASGGLTLVGAIELVSPANKDRHDERRAFATKCASYLHQGVSLVVADIVTSRHANLHNEIVRLMEQPEEFALPDDVYLYATAYRPVKRQDRAEIDFWTETCALGTNLPVLPLRLTGDLFVPVDLEATYQEACRRRRLA